MLRSHIVMFGLVFFQTSKFCRRKRRTVGRIHENNQCQMSRKSGQWLWTNNQYSYGIKPTTCSHQLVFSCLPVRMGLWYPVLQTAINDNVRNGNQWRHCSRDLTFSLLQSIRNRTQEYVTQIKRVTLGIAFQAA